MNTHEDSNKKQLEAALAGKSVAINEGTFMLRVNKADVDRSDFVKQCLYGDSFRSAYSPHLVMIPTSTFLPQMFVGKNVFMEHKLGGGHGKVPMLDSFLPFAFLLTREDDGSNRMFDELFAETTDGQSYGSVYGDMRKSVLHHLSGTRTCGLRYPNEMEMLTATSADEETDRYLKENEDAYTVIFLTQSSSVRVQQSDAAQLRFGEDGSNHVVSLSNNGVARFDGLANVGDSSNVTLSRAVTSAIKRELLTLTQLFVGYEKRPSENFADYVKNVHHLFNGQFKSIDTADENVESYSLAALKLYLSRNLEIDDFPAPQQSPILGDLDFRETIERKVLFQLLMIMDAGSCFNARSLVKKEVSDGKPTIVSAEPYVNPFVELVGAVYENVSWLTHLLTSCMFFARMKNRSCCQSCNGKVCAVNAPSLMLANRSDASAKKERTAAVACFYTSTAFNKTGPLGNLKHVQPTNGSDGIDGGAGSNTVMWEKQHGDLLRSLVDSYHLELTNMYDATSEPTTGDNIDERAKRCMKHVCSLLDGAIGTCEEFCRELEDGADSVAKVNSVESEIRNVYRIAHMYDKGIANVLLSESLMYLLRCVLLFEQSNFSHQSVNDVFLKVRPLLLDNKSGFSVSSSSVHKSTAVPKIAVKSYSSDGMTVDVDTQVAEHYSFDDLLYNASFKTKTYLYGRFDEKRNNGGRKRPVVSQNMTTGRRQQVTSAALNNSFLHFKNFCSKQACDALGIRDDDYCRDVLNDVRDDCLDKYAWLFRYVAQYKVDDWPSVLQLVSAMKLLEHLNFTPSFDKLTMLSFNRLSKNSRSRYQFEQNLIGDDFNNFESLYAQNCSVVEFGADIQGKRLVFKKCSGRFLDGRNELLTAFSNSKMNPGSPVFYITFGEKKGGRRFQDSASSTTMLDNFLNVEQYKLEKDAAYTSYVRKNRKQFYDDVFAATFGDHHCIDNRYAPELLEEMMTEFDELFPPHRFASEQINAFLKLVLKEYLNPDQGVVIIAAKRIREVNARAVNRKRPRSEDVVDVRDQVDGDEDDDEDYKSMNTKRARYLSYMQINKFGSSC
jgi:hypothetical protein